MLTTLASIGIGPNNFASYSSKWIFVYYPIIRLRHLDNHVNARDIVNLVANCIKDIIPIIT